MLAIRMQRTGRKGHAMFRVIVQDSRITPTSGKIVALLGSYDPHAKTTSLDKDKAAAFLKNGAQPSERVALLLKREGVKLPSWVEVDTKKAGKLKHAEKLRKNRSSAEATDGKPADADVSSEAAAKDEEPAAEPAAEAEAPAADQSSEASAKDEATHETETKDEA